MREESRTSFNWECDPSRFTNGERELLDRYGERLRAGWFSTEMLPVTKPSGTGSSSARHMIGVHAGNLRKAEKTTTALPGSAWARTVTDGVTTVTSDQQHIA